MRAPISIVLAALLSASLACATDGTDEPGPPADEQPVDGAPPGDESPVDGAPDTTRLSTRSLYDARNSSIERSSRIVIRSPSEWEAFWNEAHQGDAGPAPSVDFERSMVLAAAMGRRPTGGHDLAIESVLATDGSTVVEVVETSPGAGCVTTQALTAPAVAVAVDRRSGEIEWSVRQETVTC